MGLNISETAQEQFKKQIESGVTAVEIEIEYFLKGIEYDSDYMAMNTQ